jgi:hypothetical protein
VRIPSQRKPRIALPRNTHRPDTEQVLMARETILSHLQTPLSLFPTCTPTSSRSARPHSMTRYRLSASHTRHTTPYQNRIAQPPSPHSKPSNKPGFLMVARQQPRLLVFHFVSNAASHLSSLSNSISTLPFLSAVPIIELGYCALLLTHDMRMKTNWSL